MRDLRETVKAYNWEEEFKASYMEPVCVEVCEKFTPDYPSTEGSFAVHLMSKQEMLDFMETLRAYYYLVESPMYDDVWTRKCDDGFKHWGVIVYEHAPIVK